MGLGYQFIFGDAPGGNGGGLAARLFSVGYRPFWAVSFGVQLLNAGIDLSEEGTQFIASANPGLYVRGHSQQRREPMGFDFWGGLGFQPLAMTFAVFESTGQALSAQDLSQQSGDSLVTAAAKGEFNVGDLVTYQTYNISLDLGASLYLTERFAVELQSALTFWVPVQECFFIDASGDRLCFDSDLEGQTSFYLGLGVAFLP